MPKTPAVTSLESLLPKYREASTNDPNLEFTCMRSLMGPLMVLPPFPKVRPKLVYVLTQGVPMILRSSPFSQPVHANSAPPYGMMVLRVRSPSSSFVDSKLRTGGCAKVR